MKSIYRITTTLLTFFLLAQCTLGQTNRLYTTRQGLVTSDITSLCVDSRGLAWLVGKNSVGYFDGQQFHYIPVTNPETGHPFFSAAKGIKEDKEGNFWIMSNRGLYHLDVHTQKFKYVSLWDSEKEAYVESEWSAKQTKVFDENVQLGEDGHLHLAISEEEARKLGVTRRMYKTFLYNINQANQNLNSFGDSIEVSCPVGSKPFANKR